MKNQNIKLIFLFLLSLLVTCGDTTTDSSSATPTVNTLPFTIVEKYGNPVELTISNHDPSKALVGATEWVSSDTNVATITGGVVRFAQTPTPTNVIITATIGAYSTNKEVNIESATNVGLGIITTKGSQKIAIIFDSMTGLVFQYKQLTSIIISDSVTNIGVNAFANNQLTSATIGNSVRDIGHGSFQNNQLVSVIIPDSVETISSFAFEGNQLTNVTIGNSVTNIGLSTFGGNQLTRVIIPNSVRNIENKSFQENPSLTSVTLSVPLYNSLGTRRETVFGTNVKNWYKLDGSKQE